MKLFYAPRTRSSRPRWLLEELGVPYELVRLNPAAGETQTDAHAARHPLRHVPVLETDEGTLFESSALLLHIAERNTASGLIPEPASYARGLVYQWFFYAMTELEPHLVIFNTQKLVKKTPESPEAIDALRKLALAFAPVNSLLEKQPFMLGDSFTMVDVLFGAMLAWANRLGTLSSSPAIVAYVERMVARPAYKRATAD